MVVRRIWAITALMATPAATVYGATHGTPAGEAALACGLAAIVASMLPATIACLFVD